MSDLETRLQWMEDRFAIQDLIVSYAIAIDDRDMDTVADLYSPDAVFDSVLGRKEGREAVVDYYDNRLAEFGATYHIPYMNSCERVSDTEATGTVLAAAELAIDGKAFVTAIRYHDHYVKGDDGKWRFRERGLEQLYAMNLEDLPDGLGSDLRKRWAGQMAAADIPENKATWTAHRAKHGLS
ncbi:MAG: nuclear transport factor 2 family protein [Acidimicrobiales bacterium]